VKNKIIEVSFSLPLWLILLISVLNAFVGYSLVVALRGVLFGLFFAVIVFVLSFVFIPFLPVFLKIYKFRKEIVKMISPD